MRGFEDIIALGETEFLANTIGVSTGLNHMRKVGAASWTSVSDHAFGVRTMWRAPGTPTKVYFANTPGNGPAGGGGGIYRWVADAYTLELATAGPNYERINAIWGRNAAEVYAAGDDGMLVRSTGNGTWTPLASGTTLDASQIWSWNGSLVVASASAIHVVP